MRVVAVLAAGLALSGCGSERCDPPAGCLRTEKVAGACACVEWQTVSTEAVRLPYVVSGVLYPIAGNASVARLGPTWDPTTVPQSASRLGTLLRAVIRRPDGSEVIARVGALDGQVPAERVSATSVFMRGGGGAWILTPSVDLTSPGLESLSFYTNVVATVGTDAGGGKTADWSWAPPCYFFPSYCTGADAGFATPAVIRGEEHWDVHQDDFLASLTTTERAALLAFDPIAAGSATTWPRYQSLGPVELTDAMEPAVRDASWSPCADPQEFVVLAETAVPMSGGDTFVLQYGVQHDASCTAQRPGLITGTTTPGCSLGLNLLVDRLAGTLLMDPTYASSACTRL